MSYNGVIIRRYEPDPVRKSVVSLSLFSLSPSSDPTIEWPRGVRVLNRGRAHITGYLRIPNLALSWLKARRFSMDLTVCPSVWGRLSKLWQERLGKGYIPRPHILCQALLIHLVKLNMPIRDIQQMLFQRYGYKLRIKTLQRWIMSDRYRRRSTDIHYWSAWA